MSKYPVYVKCPVYKYRLFKKTARKYGLKWNNENGFIGIISRWRYSSLKKACDNQGLLLKLENDFCQRSSDYRKEFFIHNKPHLLGKFYFCAYCGQIMSHKKLTVDHIYPVAKAGRSLSLQKKLQKKNFESINDYKNLVASCYDCNFKKKDKGGIWILRGKIGRYPQVWFFINILRMVLCIGFIVCGIIYFANT